VPREIVNTTDSRIGERVEGCGTEIERTVCTSGATIGEGDSDRLALVLDRNLAAAKTIVIGVPAVVSGECVKKVLTDRSNEVGIFINNTASS